jgi:HK97 family phage major capsid protein
MAQSIQALREQIAARAREVKALVEDKNATWNEELQAKYDAALAEIEDCKAQIDRIERTMNLLGEEDQAGAVADAAAARARREGEGGVQAQKIRKVFENWMRNGDRALSAEDWNTIRNTMSTTTGSEGGFTVATTIAAAVADALKAFGGMRSVATVLQTVNGATINFPNSDGTAEEGEIVAQNVSATDLDVSFGTTAIEVFKYSSKVVAVPVELLQDASIDIEAFVTNRCAQRVGRISNKHFTIGTGTGQPKGVQVAATAGKVGATGQTTSITFEDLIDLEHSVDVAYREGGRCRWMMNDATFKAIKKMKDTAGRPIFIPGYDGLAGAVADSILGYPVTINNHMPVMAANAKSVLFGDFSHYIVRDVVSATEMQRYTDSAYAKKGQIGFNLWARAGGNFTDVGGAVKYYQNSAT